MMEKGSGEGNNKRTRAEQRKRDTMQAYAVIFGVLIVIMAITVYIMFLKKDVKTAETVQNNTSTAESAAAEDSDAGSDEDSDEDSPDDSESDESTPEDNSSEPQKQDEGDHKVEVVDGRTYVDGILVVNKTYSLPAEYAPGILPEAQEAFDRMANSAWGDGLGLFICSGFRSYSEQKELYDGYALQRGVEEADKVSARAGHSEHQSGLAMDINSTDFEFEYTAEAKWLAEHCAEYGFIIRYPKGKESITGYSYEPWHIRYVGEDIAKELTEKNICLEEYLGLTSDYRYSKDQPFA